MGQIADTFSIPLYQHTLNNSFEERLPSYQLDRDLETWNHDHADHAESAHARTTFVPI